MRDSSREPATISAVRNITSPNAASVGSGHCKKIVTHAGRGGALGDLDRGHPEMQSLPPHWLVIIVPHGRRSRRTAA
jgi:hypothetical protein